MYKEVGKMKTIKVVVVSRYTVCPFCKKKCDGFTGISCSHLQKILIRTDKKHVAIFKG